MLELTAQQLPSIIAHCRELGWIAPSTSLIEPSAAGVGNMNRTLRVRLSGQTESEPASLVLKQAVPYVAKYPDIAAPIERGASEAAFYTAIGSHLPVSSRMPALLGFDPTQHLLCLEDLGPGADMTDLYQLNPQLTAANEQRLQKLVDWLSSLHGMPIEADALPHNLAMRRLNHEHIFVLPFDPASGVAVTEPLALLRAEIQASPTLMTRIQQLGELYLGNAPASNSVLLHGDFYPGSWLYAQATDCRVLDPEFTFIGPGEFDVGVMQAHLTFAGCNKAQIQGLLAPYRRPPGYSNPLQQQFAAVEILRRLLGVAQLPLAASPAQQHGWAQQARTHLQEAP